jgi:RNA polymerase sigma factor (sigma-70 family)
MAVSRASLVVRRLRELAGDENTDQQLLERFTTQRDEEAFAALVRRYGGLVFGVCRAILHHQQDAEDAFQATFLVLARKATSIRKWESLPSWLHGVAYRLARKAQSQAFRRRSRPTAPPRPNPVPPPDELAWRELSVALHEEVATLPAKYRTPLVLCCLEGCSRDEAAQRLDWTLAMVKDRLERGRELLWRRLRRRGVAPATALTAALVIGNKASAAPPVLAPATIQAMVHSHGGSVLAPGAVALAQTALEGVVGTRVKIGLILLLAFVLVIGGVGLASRPSPNPAPAETPPGEARPAADVALGPRTDLYGDPLPDGAVARLGSLQFRHGGLADLAFSADGKALITSGADGILKVWDVGTGNLTRSIRLEGTDSVGGCALSPDGKLAAARGAKAVTVWDALTGKQLKQIAAPKESYLIFSDDGETLVVASQHMTSVTVWRWREGPPTTLNVAVHNIEWSPDSTTHFCLSPDGKLLAVGLAARVPLTVWDLGTGKHLFNVDAGASVSRFTPDGKQLAIATAERNGRSTLLLHDVATGKEVRRLPLPGKGFHWCLTFSPDGKVTVPVDTEGIYLLDSASGKELRRVGGSKTGRQRWAVFSPDGRVLASHGGNPIHLWDADTGKELHVRACADYPYGLAYTPDGSRLAIGNWVESNLSMWDTKTGRQAALLPSERDTGYVRSLTFAPDARTLVVGRLEGFFDFVDATTGKTKRTLCLHEAKGAAMGSLHFSSCSLSSDGRWAYAAERTFSPVGSDVWIWETNPGRLVASRHVTVIPHDGWVALGDKVAFLTTDGVMVAEGESASIRSLIAGAWSAPLAASPDHHLLAALGAKKSPQNDSRADKVHVWEARSGQEVAVIATGPVNHLALSGDGRTLITADTKSLRLWDLASGKERHRIALPDDFGGTWYASGLFVSPSGHLATTPCGDGTLLVWDLPRRARPEGTPKDVLSNETAAELWADLAAKDGNKAYAAMWKLADLPASAVALFGKHLKPAPPADADKVRRLVQDLDSDKFAIRQAAGQQLEEMGRAVAPALRRALEGKNSLETRQRLEGLLAKLAATVLSPDVVRRLRAIQVLEQIATPEARQLLRGLAEGPASWEKQEAQAALDRLAAASKT